MTVYLDYVASKPVDPRVTEAMLPYFYEKFGNPASLHHVGDKATDTLEKSRQTVAEFIHAESDEIIFTAGATEANNLALLGYSARNQTRGRHLVISEIEHISIHNLAKSLVKQGFTVSKVPVDRYGRVHPHKIAERITPETILVSVEWADNEIGTIQPIAEIAALCREKGVAFHTDAVAAAGLVPLDVGTVPIDLMTLSSNDIYGPPGTGALFVRRGVKINPLIIGGGQEKGLRSGTENIPGIVGMARAAEIARMEMGAEAERLQGFRDRMIASLSASIPKSHLNGHPRNRLPNNVHFRFDGIEGEALLLSLKDEGIAVSTGSACSSKTLEPSHTLIALGLLHEEAHGSLELTVGRFSRETDIDAVLEVLPGVVERLRVLSPLYESGDKK